MISAIETAAGGGNAPIYQVKVVLLDSGPPVWRRLQVSGDARLDWLHAVLQVAIGWTNSHLHQFKVGEACYSDSIGDFLRPIQQFCTEQHLPPLTSLIVSDQTGLPGDGFIAAADVPKAHIQVFEHPWLDKPAPSVEQLEDAYRRAPAAR